MAYKAVKCPCGHRSCKDWHIEPVAAVQGIKFTEQQATAVASFLNIIESDAGDGAKAVQIARLMNDWNSRRDGE